MTVLNFIEDTLYMGIITTMLKAFACNYDDLDNIYLKADPVVKCFSFQSPTHILYMGIATASLIAFYPLATILAPNLQFQNKALDLKFDATFLILKHQGTVMVSALSVFYADTVFIVLVPQLVICIILALCTEYTQPCMVRRVNVWQTAAYAGATSSCLVSIIYNLFPGVVPLFIYWVLLGVSWAFIYSTAYKIFSVPDPMEGKSTLYLLEVPLTMAISETEEDAELSLDKEGKPWARKLPKVPWYERAPDDDDDNEEDNTPPTPTVPSVSFGITTAGSTVNKFSLLPNIHVGTYDAL
jgi:hypothetical protein